MVLWRPLLLLPVLVLSMGDAPVALAIPARDQVSRVHCLPNSTVYLSKGYNPSKQYTYELVEYEKQEYAHDATIDADWTIRTLDGHTGRVLSELLLEWSCPVGRGNCQISPRFMSKDTDYQPVDEIPLNPDFTIAAQPGSPAIVIPGFVEWQWGYVAGLEKEKDLKFFTKDEVVPDLSDQLTWVRASCLDKSSAH